MFESRRSSDAGNVVVFGPYRLDRRSGVLYRDGTEVALPRKAIDVLTCLVEHPNRTLSKSSLLDRVWEGTSVTDQSLIEAIRQLRHALGDDPRHPTYIKTAHRRGYRFIAAVSIEGARTGAATHVRGAARPPARGRRPHPAEPDGPRARSSIALLAFVATASMLGLWRYGSLLRPPPAPPPVQRIPLSLPNGLLATAGLAISRDGAQLAYVAGAGDATQIVRKELDDFEFTRVEGTEGARGEPSFSPEGGRLAFTVRTDTQPSWTIKTVPVGGGSPVTVASFETGIPHIQWAADNRIYIALAHGGGIYRVSPAGLGLEPVRGPAASSAQTSAWPQLLPDGETLVFTSISTVGAATPSRAVLLSLETGEERVLLEGVSGARFVPTGHLVYRRNGSLWARPFNPSTRRFGAEERRLGPAIEFAVSANGTRAHIERSRAESLAVEVSPDGRRRPLAADTEGCAYPSLSPDRTKLALACDRATLDIMVGDVERETFTRWLAEGDDFTPIWTPDGNAVTYSKYRGGVWSLRTRPVGGGGSEETLLESPYPLYPSSWSPDGKVLAFQWNRPETGEDIWLLTAGERAARPWLSSAHDEGGAKFSPDGEWIAYHSKESGWWQVYAAPFSGLGEKLTLSSGRGGWPIWLPDGSALVYLANPRSMAMIVDLEPGPGLIPRRPRLLLEGPTGTRRDRQGPAFDVAPDGESLLVIGQDRFAPPASEILVVFSWFEELRQSGNDTP